MLYGYRVDGPQNWNQGHRFDINIILVDPYAKLVEGRRYFGDASLKLSKFLGTYDFDSSLFDWGDNYKLPNIPEVPKLLPRLLFDVHDFTFRLTYLLKSEIGNCVFFSSLTSLLACYFLHVLSMRFNVTFR